MSERERLTYDPFPDERDFVNETAERLDQVVGPRWSGWHVDDAVPGAALFARFIEDPRGRLVLAGVMLLSDSITTDQLRKVPVSALENSANLSTATGRQILRDEIPKLPKLVREPDMKPDEFCRLVADHYRQWAAAVPHPAAAMAAQSGVKPPTMHAWIREARQRGFLPPARGSKSNPIAEVALQLQRYSDQAADVGAAMERHKQRFVEATLGMPAGTADEDQDDE